MQRRRRRGRYYDDGTRRPNNLLQQTAALLSVSQGILPSRPPLLSFGVRFLSPSVMASSGGASEGWVAVLPRIGAATRWIVQRSKTTTLR